MYSDTTQKPRPLPIKPPRSNKNNKIQGYSLFDTMSPPFDWLNMNPKTRAQSVSLDDNRSSFENNDIWRRGSLPNFKSCVVCNQHTYSTKICHHSICQDCITSCPLCPTKVKIEYFFFFFLN